MNEPYQDLVNEIQDSLSYSGFDPIVMRKKIIEDFTPEEVVKIICIYVMTGSAITEKISKKKVANMAEAKELSSFLKQKKVFGKKVNLDSYTLTRFALTFPVVVMKVKLMMKPMPAKVETSTPYYLQDLCFNSYVSEETAFQATDFVERFSYILAKVANPTVTIEESHERVLAFRKIGSESHKSDHVGQAAFALDVTSVSMDLIMRVYGFEGEEEILKVPGKMMLIKTKAEREAKVKTKLSKEELAEIGYKANADVNKTEVEKAELNRIEKEKILKLYVNGGV